METYNMYIEDSELNMYRNMQTRLYQRANSNVNSNFQTLFLDQLFIAPPLSCLSYPAFMFWMRFLQAAGMKNANYNDMQEGFTHQNIHKS